MPEPTAQPAATPQRDAQQQDGWAPGWRQSPATAPKAPSFGEAINSAADDIAKDLGLDTSQPKQPQKAKAEPEAEDPNGDDELEFAPGKRVKRKELAKRLTEFEALQKKHAELERGSGQKFREAAEQRKLAEKQLADAKQAMFVKERLETVMREANEKQNPDLILQELGIDPQAYAQKKMEQAYADSQKSPEQREIDRLKAYEQQVAEYQRQQHLEAQKRQQAEQERQSTEATQKLAGNLSQSMMATADKMGLPKTALTIQRMANLLAGAQAKGLDPTWQQLGEATHKQYLDDASQLFETMSYEDFHAKISQKTREKIRQFFLQKATGSSPTQPQGSSAPQPKAKPQRALSAQEYNDYVNQLRQPRSA